MACMDYSSGGAVAEVLEASTGEVPTAEALAAAHVRALGDDSSALPQAVRMTGRGEGLLNTVRGSVELDWASDADFAWRDESGFRLAHDAEIGWTAGTRGLRPDDAPCRRERGGDGVRGDRCGRTAGHVRAGLGVTGVRGLAAADQPPAGPRRSQRFLAKAATGPAARS